MAQRRVPLLHLLKRLLILLFVHYFAKSGIPGVICSSMHRYLSVQHTVDDLSVLRNSDLLNL